MPAPTLLDLATDLVHAVWRFEAPADAVVAEFFRQHRALGPRERRLLTDTVYEAVRRRLRYEHQSAAFAPRGDRAADRAYERRIAMLAWRGEPARIGRDRPADELAWLTAARGVAPATLPAALRHNLPDWLATSFAEALGAGDEFDRLVASLEPPAPLDLRVNPLKARRDDVRAELAAAGIDARPTPYSPWGLRVEGRASALNRLPAFGEGRVEVQDEGSQLLALLTDARRGAMVVDFCAGAGGKTLALGASMRNTGRLYAFDVSGHRLAALKPRLDRSGLSNIYPMQIAHERDERLGRLAGRIDRVLVDAPCSGLGTLRRHPDLKWRQTPATVEELARRQQAILDAAARLPAPGGRLIYATCSLLPAENEAVAEAFERTHAGFARRPVADLLEGAVPEPRALATGDFLHLWPHRHNTDGFFAAAWERR